MINDRKVRKYKAALAAERGIDYYARESSARKNTAARSKAKKLLRRRKADAKTFFVVSAKPCMIHGKALARASKKLSKLSPDYRNGKCKVIA